MKTLTKTIIATSVAVFSGLYGMQSSAQALEEVVVTATKRAEGLQDVPIAISVMSGAAIEERGLTNLEDLTVYMPNIHVAEGGAGTQLFIRGIGSGINYGFEQSVGTFIDGVYYGRGRSARGKFLDIERVEVLKGPQSTLFGKNTIAGAINITTARPTDEFESYIEGSYRTEMDGVGITGMISGPLTDSLRGRLVAKKYEDDGYVENKASGGKDGPQQDNLSVRAVLDWDATEDLNFLFKAEHNENDVIGRQQVLSKANPGAIALYQAFGDPNFRPGFDWEQYDLGFTRSDLDNLNDTGFAKPGLFDDTESDVYQLTVEWRLGEHTLRSITAHTEYEFTNELDSDYSPLRLINRGRTEEHEQFSQELLWSSPTGDFLEFLAGAYYQDEELRNDRHTFVILSNVPPIEAGIFSNPALAPLNLPSTSLDLDGLNTFQQDSESWSVFTEFTFNLTDFWRVTAGIRYSEDDKDAEKIGTLTNLNGLVPDPLFALVWGPAALNLAAAHEYKKSRSEDHTTGNINVQWDVTDDAMLYVNWANGYKAGGFDEDNSLGREYEEEYGRDLSLFEDEEVDSWEIGAKMTLAEGRGRMNVAYFQSDYEDVQVSAFDGNGGFIVGNAAETEVEGIEADLEFAITDSLVLNAAVAWLDATYKSFKDAACTEPQVLEHAAETGARRGCFQDLSGKTLQFAPEYTFNFGARYDTSLTDSLDLGLGVDYLWSDDVAIANDLDPHLIQGSYDKWNARVSLSASDGSWIVSLIGKNLGDEKTFTWGNDVPLAVLGFSETYFKHIDPPSTWELNARYSF
jgi:outer membrane receptor protein involved in Fe transport